MVVFVVVVFFAFAVVVVENLLAVAHQFVVVEAAAAVAQKRFSFLFLRSPRRLSKRKTKKKETISLHSPCPVAVPSTILRSQRRALQIQIQLVFFDSIHLQHVLDSPLAEKLDHHVLVEQKKTEDSVVAVADVSVLVDLVVDVVVFLVVDLVVDLAVDLVGFVVVDVVVVVFSSSLFFFPLQHFLDLHFSRCCSCHCCCCCYCCCCYCRYCCCF